PVFHTEAKELSMSSAVTTQVTDLQNYVNGAWRRSAATEYFDVTNPATAKLLARTPLSTSADVDAAVQAAADAFPAWRRTPPGERFLLVPSLRHRVRKQFHPEAVRACSPLHASRFRALGEDRPAQRSGESRQRRERSRQRTLRPSASARH